MESIGKVVSQLDPSQPLTEYDKRQASTDDPVMVRLWLRMVEIYGHKWTSSYGETPNESWIRCLADVEPAQIAKGLNALLARGDEWPPTAVGFRNLCIEPDAWERQAHKEYRPERLLVDQGAKSKAKEAGEHFFSEMRELFK